MIKQYMETTGNPDIEIKEGRYTIEDTYYGTVEFILQDIYIGGIYGLKDSEMRLKYIKSIKDKFNDV